MGAARPDPHPAPYRVELETVVDRRRARVSVGWPTRPLVLSNPPGHVYRHDTRPLFARPEAALPRPAGHAHLGWSRRAQRSPHGALPRGTAALVAGRTAAGLCPGAQPRRTALGQPEGPRIGQPLPGGHRGAAVPRSNGLHAYPAPARARRRLSAPCRPWALTCLSRYLTRVISGKLLIALPDLASLGLFIAAALVLLITPGPAVLYIVARSIDQGRRAGLVSMLGVHAGTLVHVAAAAAGLS